MDSVHLLWHTHQVADDSDDKLIGVYKSRKDAEAAIERLRDKPGFKDAIEGFEICDYVVGRDGWTEGYVSWAEAMGQVNLTDLIGKEMWGPRRAADMATFQFGRRNPVVTVSGQESQVGDYALHAQCPWRIVKGHAVVVGNQDLYYPAQYDEAESVADSFNWDTEPSRRDRLLNALFGDGSKDFVVQGVDVGTGGTMRIEFDQGLALELFPADSLSHEHWRLFATGEGGPHLVRTGTGLEQG
jgi:hypothetical protein